MPAYEKEHRFFFYSIFFLGGGEADYCYLLPQIKFILVWGCFMLVLILFFFYVTFIELCVSVFSYTGRVLFF